MPHNVFECGEGPGAASPPFPGREEGFLKGGTTEARRLTDRDTRRLTDRDTRRLTVRDAVWYPGCPFQILYMNPIENWRFAGRMCRSGGNGGGSGAVRGTRRIHSRKDVRKRKRKRKRNDTPASSEDGDVRFNFSRFWYSKIGGKNRMDDSKTVSVRMTEEEVKKMSRTRRRRRPSRVSGEEPVAAATIQKVDAATAPATAPATTATAATAVPVVKPTTAAIPDATAKPRILFTKKAHVVKSSSSLPVPSKKPTLIVPLKMAEKVVAKTQEKVPEKTQAKKTRRFRARRLKVTLNARGTASAKAAKRVAAMSITDVRAQLVKEGLLKGKTRTPPEVLRGMLTEWLQLHAGA